jgi:hypothetical protein
MFPHVFFVSSVSHRIRLLHLLIVVILILDGIGLVLCFLGLVTALLMLSTVLP